MKIIDVAKVAFAAVTLIPCSAYLPKPNKPNGALIKRSLGVEKQNVLCEGKCESRLETLINGENGSYGNMFEVRAKKDLFIDSVEFYCDLKQEVSYEIYSKSGTYNGFEKSPDDWTLVSKGTVMAGGPNTPTSTPEFDSPFLLEAGLSRAFYVTLLNPDIRYTFADTEGEVFTADDNLEILVGIGVAAYPFGPFFYRPRLFNGAVNYHIFESYSPSAVPSTVLSSVPTIHHSEAPSVPPATIITYSYLLEHDASSSNMDILTSVDFVVTRFIEDTLIDDNDFRLRPLVEPFGIELVGVNSNTVDMSSRESLTCEVGVDTHVCSLVDIVVQVRHDDTISEAQVRHTFLVYANKIEDILAFPKKEYVGRVAVETQVILSIHGPQLEPFPDVAIDIFEGEMMNYVDSKLGMINLADVRIDEQIMSNPEPQADFLAATGLGAKPKKRKPPNRALQTPDKSSLDLAVTVTGEYLPPPKLDLGVEVTESLSENGDGNDFVDVLKKFPEFEKITSIEPRVLAPEPLVVEDIEEVAIENTDDFNNDFQVANAEKKGFMGSTASYVLFAIIGFIMVAVTTVFGFLYIKNKKKNETHPEPEYDSIERMEIHDDRDRILNRAMSEDGFKDDNKRSSLTWDIRGGAKRFSLLWTG